ncbi:coadhesin-like [Branchiostoma floridae x Branchiostoma japonicum]
MRLELLAIAVLVAFTGSTTAISGWTIWFDISDPISGHDTELLADIYGLYPTMVCPSPLLIQAETTAGVPALDTNQVLRTFDADLGLECYDTDQPGYPFSQPCEDYKVRFFCEEVNGQWSPWTAWSLCDRTCGGGTETRTRTCDNPPPSNGGADCVGESTETGPCATNACPQPVDGGWTAWSDWSVCSVTCGTGTQFRARSCTNPAPVNGGSDCQGLGQETRQCNAAVLCPIDGGWGAWSNWTACDVTCGGGLMHRTRECDSPAPEHGGNPCVGNNQESVACGTGPCPGK